MSNHAVMPLQDYVDTCEAIREKTGSTDAIKSGELASGVNEVYEAGKKAEYDEFWDEFMPEDLNIPYIFAGGGWCKDNFKPPRDFSITQGIFYQHNYSNNKGNYDLAAHLEELGIKITKTLNTRDAFNFARFTRIPELDLTTSTANKLTSSTFNGMYYLYTIDKLTVEQDREYQGTFTRCDALKNITFDGVIGRNISFSYSPLSVESMKSVIMHLKDYSGTDSEFTYKVTFSSACLTALEAEGATAEYNGEACTWTELITDKKKWELG